MAFTTIFVSAGLSPAQRRRAIRCGPRAVASRAGYRRLLGSAGFDDVDAVDVTEAFAATAAAWISERAAFADTLRAKESEGTGSTSGGATPSCTSARWVTGSRGGGCSRRGARRGDPSKE